MVAPAAVASSLGVLSVLLAISVGVPLLSSSAARAAVPSAALEDDWVEVRSGNFIVFSNSGAGEASDVARRLERLREVLGATNPTPASSRPPGACSTRSRAAPWTTAPAPTSRG